MKNLILIVSVAFVFQQTANSAQLVAGKVNNTATPATNDAPVNVATQNAPAESEIVVIGTLPPAQIDIETLKTYTPEAPRKLSPVELDKMLREMKAMNRLPRTQFKKVLPRVKYIQYSYEFTKTAGVKRKDEMRVYLVFSYRAIQVDPTTESKEYFHNAYELFKSDFDRVMATLSPAQRAFLYKADEEARRIQADPTQDDGESYN